MALPPVLETERLQLSPPGLADAGRVIELMRDPLISRMTLAIPFPYTETDAVQWLHSTVQRREAGTSFVYAIRLRDEPDLLGAIGLHLDPRHGSAELGYWMGAPHRGKGFVREAVRRLVAAGFEHLDVVRIEAHHKEVNAASGRVLQNSGLRREARLEAYIHRGGETHSVIVYRILRHEWESPEST